MGDVSLEYSREAESLNITDPGMEKEGAVSFSSEREKQLLTELEELKQKKKQAERLMGQLSTMKGIHVAVICSDFKILIIQLFLICRSLPSSSCGCSETCGCA